MGKMSAVLVLSVILAFAIAGCSDESIVPSEDEQVNATGVVRGEIDPGGSFEYKIGPANAVDPLVGPFVLRGDNIHYVDSLSALSVDLTMENQGEVSHPEPIGLTFTNFLPGDVTVTNPDNDEHGPGAAIRFEFDNDDNEWTPGEKSLPRAVQFGVDSETSIGFIALVDIPQDTTLGTIGGIVWHDIDEDGEIDNEEPGIGGKTVYLISDEEPDVTLANAEFKLSTVTGPDGSYRFEDLEAGFYQVIREFRDLECRPTTSTVIYVTLVESNGTVSDFMLANFGCVLQDEPPPPDKIEVGDFVKVNGEFEDEPDYRIMARSIEVFDCDRPPPPDSMLALADGNGDWGNGCDDWDHDDCDDGNDDDCDDRDHDWDDCPDFRCWGLKSELRGPVTDINADERAVEIMGTWVHFARPDSVLGDPSTVASSGDRDGECPWLGLDKIEIGDRVRVRVFRHPESDVLYGLRLKCWEGTPEKVFGIVESVSAPSGPIEAITVLGVMVVITNDTDICFKE
jgi:hypothetical protein